MPLTVFSKLVRSRVYFRTVVIIVRTHQVNQSMKFGSYLKATHSCRSLFSGFNKSFYCMSGFIARASSLSWDESNGDEGIDEESRDSDEVIDVDVTTSAGSLIIK